MVTPAARRNIVNHLKEEFQFSERRACTIVGLRIPVKAASRTDVMAATVPL
ncbi:hypothetical protein JZM60_16380 [Geobacter benzoatilyticus]|uniref:Uncharacterized protein n=1 Tax=Geobacter benzoatilyticus TaxID=2815309 RepID=A0ABX7Q2M0_9BACT|nr:hypothetical protein JZM60_16380 [Geobacter benzoatilyticus]